MTWAQRLSFSAVVLLSSISSVACRPQRPVMLNGPEGVLTVADYRDVLKTWTRSDKIYQGLENKLFITATYHSPEFRRAFAVAFPNIYGVGGTVTRRELVELSGGVEQYNNFLVTAYTPDVKWNDFSKADSIWRLTLTGAEGVTVLPTEIISVKIDENLRAVYPYIDRFDRSYLVRFPAVDALNRKVIDETTQRFHLRAASALGEAELTWQLSSVPSPAMQ